jgi:beta-glucanase (GH16 family)
VFTYGYLEVRCKLPSGRGFWPAVWMLPGSGAQFPEIDLLEILGHAPNQHFMHFHFVDARGTQHGPGHHWSGPDFAAGWHTFALDWSPQAIVWYVDGVERWRYTDTAVIPAEPMYIMINLAVGGSWPGEPDVRTVFPNYFDIDYVRVWKKG